MTAAIGITFGPLEPTTKNVLSFLLICQNSIQRTFEFRIYECPPNDPLLSRLHNGTELTHLSIATEMSNFANRVKTFNETRADLYGIKCTEADTIVIITNSTLADGYYYVGVDSWAVVALGGWENKFSPPSVVEYYLSFVTMAALEAVAPPIDRHYETRGCLFDFNANLAYARLSVLSGQLCGSCANFIASRTSAEILSDAQKLLSREWLGNSHKPSDRALVVKQLGYDLFHTTGFKPTIRQRLASRLEEEGINHAINAAHKVIVWVVLGVIAFILGLKL